MNYTENWKLFLILVQKELSRQAYQTWFNSINMLSIENNEITIEVPNRFHYEWLDSKYSSLISRSLKQSFNKKLSVKYSVIINTDRLQSVQKSAVLKKLKT